MLDMIFQVPGFEYNEDQYLKNHNMVPIIRVWQYYAKMNVAFAHKIPRNT